MTAAERRNPSHWITLANAVARAWPTFAAEQAARTWSASRRESRAATARAGASRAGGAPEPQRGEAARGTGSWSDRNTTSSRPAPAS